VRLEVIDSTTGKVLGAGKSDNADRGFAANALFLPATTNPVRLRVTITPELAKEDTKKEKKITTVDLDYAAVLPARDYGVVATQTWTGNLPPQLRTLPRGYQRAATFQLRNGSIRQGRGHSFAGHPLYFRNLRGLVVSKVDVAASGMDAMNLYGDSSANVVIENSTFRSTIDNISNRMRIFAAVHLGSLKGSATVKGNTILDYPQMGIYLYDNPPRSTVRITDNTIKLNARITNAYAIFINGLRNFEVAGNHLKPARGLGILIDSWNSAVTRHGDIHHNDIQAYDAGNLEYPPSNYSAIALRLRNNCRPNNRSAHRDLHIHDNTFMARTDAQGGWGAIGLRITELNYGGLTNDANLRFDNNLFKAVVDTPDPEFRALAVATDGIEPGTGLVLAGNVLESNDTSLSLGDHDSYHLPQDDILLVGNTLRRSREGAPRNYAGVRVGSFDNSVHKVRLVETRCENGATLDPIFEDNLPKELEIGRLVSLLVKDPAGAPLPDARVQVLDSERHELLAGTTDESGHIGIPLTTTVYRQPGEDPKQVVQEKKRGSVTVQVSAGSRRTSRELAFPPPAELVVTLPKAGP
jgi:hypothetical protein